MIDISFSIIYSSLINLLIFFQYAIPLVIIVHILLVLIESFKWRTVRKWLKTKEISLEGIKNEEFKIKYNQKDWDFLLSKLENTRYFERLDDKHVSRFEYGFDSEYAKDLVDYWKKYFNWSKQVDHLNSKQQFLITINDVKIHYVRVKCRTEKISKRLMLIDGWPGSFFGFYKMIDRLLEIDESFDIIVPSIPGYGYSTPLNKPVDILETSQLFDALMRYVHGESCEYYVHGEDWVLILIYQETKRFKS